jgi:hypothetical protein
MPFFILGLLIDVLLVIHVLKTGRNTIWIWVVVMLPMAGPIAYFVIEILPELSRSRAARRVLANAKRSIDPTRDLRTAQQKLRVNDSIDSRRRVADELCNAGNYVEAIDYYRQALVGLYQHDPHLLLGLARAQFELGEATHARETLDRLIKENPDFKSADGHLLYARALEAEGNVSKACEELATLAKYFPGAEARYRYAVLLRKTGETKRAHDVLSQLLNDAEVATKHYRKAQAEWLGLAKRDLQSG